MALLRRIFAFCETVDVTTRKGQTFTTSRVFFNNCTHACQQRGDTLSADCNFRNCRHLDKVTILSGINQKNAL